jgi:hypothetical protein
LVGFAVGLSFVENSLEPHYEAVSNFPEDEKCIVKALLEGMILKHEAKRWANV